MMIGFTATYKYFFIVVSAMMLLFPCSLKKELKQQEVTETSHHLNYRICNVFHANEVQFLKRTQKPTPCQPFFYTFASEGILLAPNLKTAEKSIILPKEKVRTYLRNRQFLI